MTDHPVAAPLVGATETLEELLDEHKRAAGLHDYSAIVAARAALVARFEAVERERDGLRDYRARVIAGAVDAAPPDCTLIRSDHLAELRAALSASRARENVALTPEQQAAFAADLDLATQLAASRAEVEALRAALQGISFIVEHAPFAGITGPNDREICRRLAGESREVRATIDQNRALIFPDAARSPLAPAPTTPELEDDCSCPFRCRCGSHP